MDQFSDLNLPPHITAHASSSRWPGHIYFFNQITGECTWAPPNFNPHAKPSDTGVDDISRLVKRVKRSTAIAAMDVDSDIQAPVFCPNCKHPEFPVQNLSDSDFRNMVLRLCPPPTAAYNDSTTVCVCPVRGSYNALLGRLVGSGSYRRVAEDNQVRMEFQRLKPLSTTPPTSKWGAEICHQNIVEDLTASPARLTDFTVAYPQEETPDLTDSEIVSVFTIDARVAPSITLDSYLERIWKYSRVSDSTMLISLIYIIRLWRSGRLVLSQQNIHKVLLTSVVAAAKFNEDATLTNKSFASVGGITLHEMNRLENAFLDLLRFRLDVTVDEWLAGVNTLSEVEQTREDFMDVTMTV